MPDKKITDLPQEATMTTPATQKLIIVGDPANGKLYQGTKPPDKAYVDSTSFINSIIFG